jgi:DNA-binding MarR family transcriptional regulator
MSNNPHEITGRVVIEFSRRLFSSVAEKYGGDTTLNELRIMNQIVVCHLNGQTCYVTALHNLTDIPIPTVSRSVAHLQSQGWLSEQRDPDDGRKRLISLGPRALDRIYDDIGGDVKWLKESCGCDLPD